MSDRYDGKPFLRLLDAWVMDAIGHLPDAQRRAIADLQPRFAELFGRTGDWRSIVVAEMRFPDGMAGAVREVWEKGRARFRDANGHDPDPAEFARTFVDMKFPR